MGKRDRRELESRLVILMLHLLKWRFQPERRQRGRSWGRAILEQRRQLAALLADSCSLRPRAPDALELLYPHACLPRRKPDWPRKRFPRLSLARVATP